MNDETSEQQLSKKERREVRRQEARDEQTRGARGRGFRRVVTWLVVVVVLVGIGWLVRRAAQQSPGGSGNAVVSSEVIDSDNVKGPENAAITVVEYGDYQCPACGAFHPIIEQLFEESDGQMRLVFRHFPLKRIHPNAEMVSRAVQAAGVQGKYWEMHDLVFERQAEWSPIPRNSARNKMLDYGEELGLDRDQLDDDIDSDAVKDKVDADVDNGEAIGVNSTPSFYVNGVKLENFNSLEEFRAAVLAPLNALDAPVGDESMTEPHGDADAMEGESL